MGKAIAVLLLVSATVTILGSAIVESASALPPDNAGGSDVTPYSTKSLLDYLYLLLISLCGIGILVNIKSALPTAALLLLVWPTIKDVDFVQLIGNSAAAVLLLLCLERTIHRQRQADAEKRRWQ